MSGCRCTVAGVSACLPSLEPNCAIHPCAFVPSNTTAARLSRCMRELFPRTARCSRQSLLPTIELQWLPFAWRAAPRVRPHPTLTNLPCTRPQATPHRRVHPRPVLPWQPPRAPLRQRAQRRPLPPPGTWRARERPLGRHQSSWCPAWYSSSKRLALCICAIMHMFRCCMHVLQLGAARHRRWSRGPGRSLRSVWGAGGLAAAPTQHTHHRAYSCIRSRLGRSPHRGLPLRRQVAEGAEGRPQQVRLQRGGSRGLQWDLAEHGAALPRASSSYVTS